MNNIQNFEEFHGINEELRSDELKKLATDLAYSMPNHTHYDEDDGPTDAQIIKAFKYFPALKQYATKKQKEEVVQIVKDLLNESVNESMDSRYFSITIKNIKSELDAIQQWVDDGDADKAAEYIDDQITTLKKLKMKCK
jgi:hypothetical protein